MKRIITKVLIFLMISNLLVNVVVGIRAGTVCTNTALCEVEKIFEDQGNIIFSGYVLGLSEELSFMNSSVYVDGVDQGSTMFSLETEINRPEIKQKYPQYNNAEKSGFRYKLNTTKLKNGQHRIKFKFIGLEKEVIFNVKNYPKILK